MGSLNDRSVLALAVITCRRLRARALVRVSDFLCLDCWPRAHGPLRKQLSREAHSRHIRGTYLQSTSPLGQGDQGGADFIGCASSRSHAHTTESMVQRALVTAIQGVAHEWKMADDGLGSQLVCEVNILLKRYSTDPDSAILELEDVPC